MQACRDAPRTVDTNIPVYAARVAPVKLSRGVSSQRPMRRDRSPAVMYRLAFSLAIRLEHAFAFCA